MTSISSYDPNSGVTTILGGGGGTNSILNASNSGQTAQDIGMQAPEQTDSVQALLENEKTYESVQNYVKQSLLQLEAYIKSPNDHTIPPKGWLRNAAYAGQNGIPIYLSTQKGKLDIQAVRVAQIASGSNDTALANLQLPDYTSAQKKLLQEALQSLPSWYKRQDVISDKKKLSDMLNNAATTISNLQKNLRGDIDVVDVTDTLEKNTQEAWAQDAANALSAKHPYFVTATVDGGVAVTDQFSDQYLSNLEYGSSDYRDPVSKQVYTQQERQMLADAIKKLQSHNANEQTHVNPDYSKNPKVVTGNTGPASNNSAEPQWLQDAESLQATGTSFSLTITKDALGNPQVSVLEQDLGSNITGQPLQLTDDEQKPPPVKWLADAVDSYSNQMPFMLTVKGNQVVTVPLIKEDKTAGLDVSAIMKMIFPKDQFENTSVAKMFPQNTATAEQMGFVV